MSDRFVALLRHGEVQGGRRFRGGRDDPLSDRGWEQMSEAVALGPPWNHVVCSPAARCSGFARRFAREAGLPLTSLDAFGERRFGQWEGLAANQIPADELARFWDDPVGFTPPGAEPYTGFRDRVLAGWRGLLSEPGAHRLLVTHGGVVRVILADLLRMPDAAAILIEVPPACLTRLRIPASPGRPSLMSHGGIA